MLTQGRLKELLHYNPETGVFVWRVQIRAGLPAGRIAGSFGNGYRYIKIEGRRFKATHLAWLWTYGCLPPPHLEVDHVNGNPADDRIANLRLATSAQNKWNTRLKKNSTSRLKGAFFHKKTGRWRSHIMRHGTLYNLGMFGTKEEAHAAYCDAAKTLFGEFARTQ